MNILITGATGYLGGCLLSYLKNKKNFNITTCSASDNLGLHVKHLRIDWKNEKSIKQACNAQDIIIHCASPNAQESVLKPEIAYEFSSVILDRFIKQAIISNVKKFIYFSSAHIYKSPLLGHLRESTILKPTHPYGISKKIAEETLLKYSEHGSFGVNIIRLSNVFGMPCNKKINPWNLVVNDFCYQALKTKKIKIKAASNQIRNFVPISEINNLINFMIEKHVGGEVLPTIFNFGGQWNLNLSQLAQIIADVYYELKGEKINILFSDKFNSNSNILNYNSDLIMQMGYMPSSNYIDEIKKIFYNLSSR